jgi:hypothetical protein
MVMLGWAQVRRQVHKAVMGHHAPNGSYTGPAWRAWGWNRMDEDRHGQWHEGARSRVNNIGKATADAKGGISQDGECGGG